eukprot:9700030-Ditylum_brightwellii.AAC.1
MPGFVSPIAIAILVLSASDSPTSFGIASGDMYLVSAHKVCWLIKGKMGTLSNKVGQEWVGIHFIQGQARA